MCRIITILLFCFSTLNGLDMNFNPVLKSVVIPGWGEKTLKYHKRARLFSNMELSLWISCIGVYTYSHHSKEQYKTFASRHAGVYARNKDHKYWVDIGNYINLDSHNTEHLRWRYFDEIYSENENWEWDSSSNMKKFEKMRIRSDYYSKSGEYILGAILLNHIISAIDTIYLMNLNKKSLISFYPIINKNYNAIGLKIVFL